MQLEHGKNEYKGLTIIIDHDDTPESPRDWLNLGTMYCEHNRYKLGDKNAEDIRDDNNSIDSFKGVVLPLYLYDHSGITMSTSGFSCPWDSGQVGCIYVSDASIRREYNAKRISKKLREKVTEQLINEVKVYDQFLTGDVYGYTIEDEDDEFIDSCWGFYGMFDVDYSAIESADYHLSEIKKQKQTQLKTWIRNRVPFENRV